MRYPVTPDGRYFVVRGRLWRCTNPHLPEVEREHRVKLLMQARSLVGKARREEDGAMMKEARAKVQEAKVALGERGPVWWTDGAPDCNRRMVKNTAYREWWEQLA